MQDFQLQLLDLIVLAIVGLSCLISVLRGFVRESLSIVAWTGSGAIMYFGIPYALPFVEPYIDNDVAVKITTGVLLFLISIIVLSILGSYISKLVQKSDLGPLDRTLGFAFGALRGAIIVTFAWLIFAMLFTPEEYPQWVKEAKSLPLLQKGAKQAQRYIPFEMAEEALAREGTQTTEGKSSPLDLTIELEPKITFPKLDKKTGKSGEEEQDSYDAQQRKELDGLFEETLE